MKILVTGTAGFIGMHVSKKLSDEGHEVIGIDNINSYYETSLKYARLDVLGIQKQSILYNKIINGKTNFKFLELDLTDVGCLMALFASQNFDIIINLAAQAGVRYSISNPKDYIESNIFGFFNLLECCRAFPVKHLVFASSSSVYGNSSDVPFTTEQQTDKPISLYAATKKTNELLAYNYSHLFGIPSTGLRFFTVYGPWGRPDMAYFNFTKKILSGEPIELYNSGKLKRDFTYVGDIVESIFRLVEKPPIMSENEPAFQLFNIGNQEPVDVIRFVETLEAILDIKANVINKPMQAGDVTITFSDTSDLEDYINFKPNTSLETGLEKFVEWYKVFYKF
jgi:UDP-glucuronate 4-epimerase